MRYSKGRKEIDSNYIQIETNGRTRIYVNTREITFVL